MNIFKKLFSKKNKPTQKEEKKAECWYNNANELSSENYQDPEQPGAQWSLDTAITKTIANK